MKILKIAFLFCILVCTTGKTFAGYEATGPITLMEYKKGLFLNSWSPEKIDGILRKDYRRIPLPKVWKEEVITFYPSKQNSNSGFCRVEYKKLRGLWYYRDHWDKKKGKIFQWDDYLKFPCEKY